MFKVLENWYHRYFSNEEAVVLVLILSISFAIVYLLGQTLAPVFTALVFAYLMQGMVSLLVKQRMPEIMAVMVVFTFFMGCLVGLLAVVLPLIWSQLLTLFNVQLPEILNQGQVLLQKLPEKYPGIVTTSETQALLVRFKQTATGLGETLLASSVSNLPNLMGLMIFLILVPVLVFFFLKDKRVLTQQVLQLLPKERGTLARVWEEMEHQIAKYVRGKVIEIFIVGVVTYLTLLFLGVNYAELLGALVGLSVVIPYIGAAVVTLPVALVGYFQFGATSEFAMLMVFYGFIQALDGNILVPLLFSEAVNLHPVIIIIAVLLFGGLWGLWGVFFAIPLATLIKAVVNAWPRQELTDSA